MIRYLLLLSLALILSGCQTVYDVEYYEPTEGNKAYSMPSTGTRPGFGPIRRIQGRSGSVNFSENLSFKISIL